MLDNNEMVTVLQTGRLVKSETTVEHNLAAIFLASKTLFTYKDYQSE